MATKVRQNVAIPMSLYKRIRGFCNKRDWTICKVVARWCREGMESDRAKEKSA